MTNDRTSTQMSIALTGSEGFIGKSIQRALSGAEKSCVLRLIDNSIDPRHDIRSIANSVHMFVDCDAVIHLAGLPGISACNESPVLSMDINVFGTFQVLRMAASLGIKRFVFASTAAAYSGISNTYALHKIQAENLCSTFAGTFHDMEVVVVRIGNVYGPGCHKKNTVIAKWLRLEAMDKEIVIHGDGEATRDFVYIDDVAECLLCAASHEIWKPDSDNFMQLYCGSGSRLALHDVAGLMMVPHVHMNEVPTYGISYAPEANIRKTISALQWKPLIKIEEGIERTRKWIRSQKPTAQSEFSFLE